MTVNVDLQKLVGAFVEKQRAHMRATYERHCLGWREFYDSLGEDQRWDSARSEDEDRREMRDLSRHFP